LLGGAHDRHRRVVIDDDGGMTAFPGKLPDVNRELLAGRGCTRAFRRPELGRCGVVRYDHLHNEELCAVPFRERDSPSDRLLGGFGPIGPDHHAPDLSVLKVACHTFVFPDGE
jgi:hypothetical protein